LKEHSYKSYKLDSCKIVLFLLSGHQVILLYSNSFYIFVSVFRLITRNSFCVWYDFYRYSTSPYRLYYLLLCPVTFFFPYNKFHVCVSLFLDVLLGALMFFCAGITLNYFSFIYLCLYHLYLSIYGRQYWGLNSPLCLLGRHSTA
jgi:hypothetical protein